MTQRLNWIPESITKPLKWVIYTVEGDGAHLLYVEDSLTDAMNRQTDLEKLSPSGGPYLMDLYKYTTWRNGGAYVRVLPEVETPTEVFHIALEELHCPRGFGCFIDRPHCIDQYDQTLN